MDLSMVSDITPEEKLLKLIRKGNSSAPDPKAGPKNERRPISGILKKFEMLQIVNVILIVASIGIAIYLVRNVAANQRSLTITPLKGVEEDLRDINIPEGILSNAKPFSFYQQALSGRNFFQYPWERPKVDQSVVKNIAADLQSQFKVVGILLDKEPKVIIEDLRTQQTIFVSRGERVGEAVLETIEEGKAVFDYNGEKIELVP